MTSAFASAPAAIDSSPDPVSAGTPQAELSQRLADQFCFTLYSTALKMNQIYRPLLKSLGLTYPQYLVLLILWEADRQSLSAIGARLDLDSATLTPLLKRLEGQGIVSRVRSAGDERRLIVSLTEEGRALKRRAVDLPYRIFCATGSTSDQLGSMKEDLETLRNRLATVQV